MEVIDFFDQGASAAPDGLCFVHGENTWTYAEARRITMQIASAFRRDHVQPGSHVAVISSGDPLAFICVLGALRAHMVWVPVIERESADEIVDKLVALDCDCLFYETKYAATARLVQERLPSLMTFICVDSDDEGAVALESWIEEDALDQFVIEPAHPTDMAFLMSTSGTTGKPKGVPRSHLDMEIQVASALICTPLSDRPRYLASSSLTFSGWNAFRYFSRGGTVYVLVDPEPIDIARTIERERITDLSLAVTRVYMMLADPEVRACDFSSLEHFAYITAPMSEAKLRDAIGLFGPIMTGGYSQTEILAHAAHFPAEAHFLDGELVPDWRLRSCGRPGPLVRLAVMDQDGRLLGPNELGELVVRGTSVLREYYKNSEATYEALRFGWLHTGDASYFDDDGYFYIVDRFADLIDAGGVQVAPSEVERVLWAHPAVRDCAVVGVPGGDGASDMIAAVVELNDGASVDDQALIELCELKLGVDKAPAVVAFWSELPRSGRNKVLKRVIRERLIVGDAAPTTMAD
jgi:acyl-CoA synthetase (AMP-forming)/AMP-acid ligase II